MSAAASADGLDQRLQAALALIAVFSSSLALSALLWHRLGARMRRDRWIRPNYRGEQIVAVSGVLVVVVGVAGAIAVAAFASLSTGRFAYVAWPIDHTAAEALEGAGAPGLPPGGAFRSPAMAGATGAAAAALALVAFSLLGYLDDTRGDLDAGGFAAHVTRSWRERRPTTGALKALGGGAAALLSVQIAQYGNLTSLLSGDGWSDGRAVVESLKQVVLGSHEGWAPVPLLRGALIVALSANCLNLLDRAPGRAAKCALAWWLCGLVTAAMVHPSWPQAFQFASVELGWFAWQSPALWAAGAVGGSVGLLRSELAEEHMLGDTGVNPVGAVLGLATVAMSGAMVEWAVLAVLAALNLASERWSFSRIIDAVPPLRWLDRLGSPYRN